jgi:hypothetical protein
MNHYQRLEATIAKEAVDRPAIALWRHFPVDDQSPVNGVIFQRQGLGSAR